MSRHCESNTELVHFPSTRQDRGSSGKHRYSALILVLLVLSAPLFCRAQISVYSSPNPSTPGSTVTFSVSGPPSGNGSNTVTFYDSGSYLWQTSTSSGSVQYSTSSLAVGTHTISVTWVSPQYGTYSSYLSQVVNPVPVSQTISFPNPGTQTVGTPLTLSATASSGLAVSFTSKTTSICTVSGMKATFIASGTCSVQATQAGNTYYTAATPVTQSFVVNGQINTVAGNGTPGYSGDGGAATSAELNAPHGVAVDSAGNLYIADLSNNCIRKVTATTGMITTVAGNGTAGYSGDGGAATSAELYNPFGVEVDSSGNIYIADIGNNRIRKVTATTGMITTFAGNGTAGYSGDGGAATGAGLHFPISVAVDASDNIYIADSYNQCIRKVTATTGIITTVAGNGTKGYSGDGGAATNAELNTPDGVAVDVSGNIYIADANNNRIRKVTASTGIITTVAGNGTRGYSGDGGAATSAELYSPTAVAVDVDVSGNIYIADDANNRIRAVGVAATMATPTIIWNTPEPVPSGTVLMETQLNALANVPGTFVYTPPAGTVITAAQTLSVTFTPTNTTDFYTATASVPITLRTGANADTGTVTLSVNPGSGYVTVASYPYRASDTPSTVAEGLANAASSSLVTVKAVDNALYIEATTTGSATNYPYSLSAMNANPTLFPEPSFVSSSIGGQLDGGAAQGAGAGVTIYSYCVGQSCPVPNNGYDPASNLLGYTDNGSGGLPNGIMGTWSFTYDSLNRLATATAAANAPAPYAGNYGCWSYDAFGNRLSQSMSTTPCNATPPLTSWASYNANNQFINTSAALGGVPYDPSGDVLNDGQNQYLYDGEGRICAVASTPMPGMTALTGYLYDADGTRVAKGRISAWSCDPALNGFQTTNDYVLGPGGEQVTEMGVDTTAGSSATTLTWQHTNVYAAGALLATYDNDGLHFYLNDPLGTRRAQTDYAGVLEQTCSSLPYGDALSCSGGSLNAPTEHHFTGKERDQESGNDYFGARYYTSTMGRWMSPDPAGNSVANFANPQTWNLYAYVLNNPLIFTDPTGLDCVYFNDSGTGVDTDANGNVTGIDHDSNSKECGKNGGAWVTGTTDASLIAQNKDGTFNIASTENGNAYFTQVMVPNPSASAISNFFGFSCSGGTSCQVGTSAPQSLADLREQLGPTGGDVYGMLQWAVKQTNGVPFLENQSFGMDSAWCGHGGAGVPGASSGWACMAHDYNYKLSGNTWPGHNADPDQSWSGGPQLQRINQQLCTHTSNILIQTFFSQGYNSTLGVGSTWGCQ